ncbi:tyrosine-type recombinase/integrase [Flexibacterium corallicola]|uniref:tyrosine-type recombinase/integrase n=1 Tax=Flexibacterium corallicola TaxID=3037259 RepID=UPI00286ED9D8|nr:tyrosine-type recombinase/integrase [Pseudovibrio sp. M1P-2-3]
MKDKASARIVSAMVLATETGQRQSDLLELLWSNVEADHIKITQNKTGKKVSIRQSQELKDLLTSIKQQQGESDIRSTHVLTNIHGKPWTQDGFQTSWGREKKKLGLTGLTFNDLRGTAITRWAESGASVPEIAALSGHSLKDVEKILEQHYLSMSQKLGDRVILRMEQEQKSQK